jgi:hypothetical protein
MATLRTSWESFDYTEVTAEAPLINVDHATVASRREKIAHFYTLMNVVELGTCKENFEVAVFLLLAWLIHLRKATQAAVTLGPRPTTRSYIPSKLKFDIWALICNRSW